MEDLLKKIDAERWGLQNIYDSYHFHNTAVDRITEAVKQYIADQNYEAQENQILETLKKFEASCADWVKRMEKVKEPRVMKVFSDEQPEKGGWYWYSYQFPYNKIPRFFSKAHNAWYTNEWFDAQCSNPTYWLELEPTPILP